MNGELLFSAFSEVNDIFVLDAAEALSRSAASAARSRRKRLLRVALVSALIAALFTIAAYASGFFTLSSRLIPPSEPTPDAVSTGGENAELMENIRSVSRRTYISLSGVTGSPEYSAAAQWLRFQGEYEQQKAAEMLAAGKAFYAWRDLDRSFAGGDGELLAISRLYGVWDKAMLEKLLEIAEDTGLALHTSQEKRPKAGLFEDFYNVYENEAFQAWVKTPLDGDQCIFEFYLARDGVIPALNLAVGGTEEFAEWEYATAQGQTVSIAIRPQAGGSADLFKAWQYIIFYNGESAAATVIGSWNTSEFSEAQPEKIAEQLADSLDFESICAAGSAEDAINIILGG